MTERAGRLEGRSLAAPAFWRQPFPLLANITSAWANGVIQPWFNLPALDAQQSGITSPSGASTSATVMGVIPTISQQDPFGNFTFIQPGVSYRMIGSSFVEVLDFDNPGNGSGNANVGNFAVSALTANTVMFDTMGSANSPIIVGAMNAGSNWSRSYFLADSDEAPLGTPDGVPNVYGNPPVFLQETWQVHYNKPHPLATVIPLGNTVLATGPNLVAGGPVGGLAVGAGIGAPGLVAVAVSVSNTPVPIVPSTINGAYHTSFVDATLASVDVSGTPTDLRVVATFPIASLPYTTTTGVVTGPAWFSAGGANIGLNGFSDTIFVPAGSTSVTTSYEAHFTGAPAATLTYVYPL